MNLVVISKYKTVIELTYGTKQISKSGKQNLRQLKTGISVIC